MGQRETRGKTAPRGKQDLYSQRLPSPTLSLDDQGEKALRVTMRFSPCPDPGAL